VRWIWKGEEYFSDVSPSWTEIMKTVAVDSVISACFIKKIENILLK